MPAAAVRRLRIAIVLLGAGAIGGCAARGGPPPDPDVRGGAVSRAPAVQPTPLLPPGVDLTGSWATGSEGEPATEKIVLHPACTHHPAVWILRQVGNALEAWSFPTRYDQGIAVRDPAVARTAASPGTISGLDVVIDDGESRYLLRYHPESGHLRGTRNGKPFWAARQVVVRTGACPGVP